MQRVMPKDTATALRTMQIIAGAIIAGVLIFGIIVAFFLAGQPPMGNPMPVLPLIAAGMALMSLAGWAIAPALISRVQRQKIAEQGASGESQTNAQMETQRAALYVTFMTQMIVRYALLEGAVFVNLIACMLERQWWNAGIAGVLALIMLAMFPTRSRVERFVDIQRELIEFERSGRLR